MLRNSQALYFVFLQPKRYCYLSSSSVQHQTRGRGTEARADVRKLHIGGQAGPASSAYPGKQAGPVACGHTLPPRMKQDPMKEFDMLEGKRKERRHKKR